MHAHGIIVQYILNIWSNQAYIIICIINLKKMHAHGIIVQYILHLWSNKAYTIIYVGNLKNNWDKYSKTPNFHVYGEFYAYGGKTKSATST